jgi:hypothetical protein
MEISNGLTRSPYGMNSHMGNNEEVGGDMVYQEIPTFEEFHVTMHHCSYQKKPKTLYMYKLKVKGEKTID